MTTLGWTTTVMPARNGSSGTCALGAAARTEHRRQVAAAIAVQQIVDDREAGVLDHARGVDRLLRHGAVLEDGDNRVVGGVGHRMQIAVERRRLGVDREAAQHLAGMLPECGADLGGDNVAARDAARADKLRRHGEARRRHRRDAEIVNDIDAAEPDVGPLDEIGELALAQARPQAVAQRHHAAIRQGGADPHPIELFGRLDLAQPSIAAVEIADRRRTVRPACHAARRSSGR